MMQLPRDGAAMTAGWPDLVDELDSWGAAERVATLWWRDDDAVAPSAKLDRLVAIAGDVPLALAVIPGAAEPELAVWLARSARSLAAPRLAVLQHGWRHADHSSAGKKSEFPAERSREEVASELTAGRKRLAGLFGNRALGVLAPPWNRFDAEFLSLLSACGFGAISRAAPRRTVTPAPGISEVNIHVDLVAWAGDRGFIGDGAALSGLIGHLRARRLGGVDEEEPTGILTHHLVQSEATNCFLRRLFAITRAHRAVRWLDGAEVFARSAVAEA
jgi:hypothetical protein